MTQSSFIADVKIKWNRRILRWTFQFYSKQQYLHHWHSSSSDVFDWWFHCCSLIGVVGTSFSVCDKVKSSNLWNILLFCHALILTLFWIVVIFCSSLRLRASITCTCWTWQKNKTFCLKINLTKLKMEILISNHFSSPSALTLVYTLVLCSLYLNLCNLPSFFSPVAAPPML